VKVLGSSRARGGAKLSRCMIVLVLHSLCLIYIKVQKSI